MLFDDIQRLLASQGVEGAIHKLFADFEQLQRDFLALKDQLSPGASPVPLPATIEERG